MKEVARALQEWQRRENITEDLAEGSRGGLQFMKSIKAMYPDIKTES